MVIDACLFRDELDLLEIRLNELDPIVDRFVIVESLEAHGSAKRREPCLEQHWDRFELFRKKIKYVVLDHLEPAYTDRISGWRRENFHRDALMNPVLEVANSTSDLVILGDCDEIPRASIVREVLKRWPSDYPFLFLMDQYFFKVNWFGGHTWDRSSIGSIVQYQTVGGFQKARGELDMVCELPYIGVRYGGWHFSSFCSVPQLREKLASFAHSSDPSVRAILNHTDEEIGSLIARGRNLFNGTPLERRASDDPRLPQHLLRYPERFSSFRL